MNTYNVHGCTCGICTVERAAARRRLDGELMSCFIADARRFRAHLVAERSHGADSLAFIARRAGLVPHADNDAACATAQNRNRLAASLIRWEREHGFTLAHGTAWAQVAR